MGLLDSIGSIVGDVVGNTLLPGIGGGLGEMIGAQLGSSLDNILGQFQQNPAGSMANPNSLPSQFVDNMLQQLGAPADFRSLVKFATDPQAAIQQALGSLGNIAGQVLGGLPGGQVPVAPGGAQGTDADGGLSTNGSNTIDTGRYLISANENDLKVYDKQTNTWVDMSGDPHLTTSDGDKASFQKPITLDLPDGTEIKIKTTPQDKNGVAYLDSAAVIKGNEAVVINGFHDGKPGVQMGHVLNNADTVAPQFQDGTVLRAGKNVSDLTYASSGKEIVGGDPNGRWGEWNLDGHGGRARYDQPPIGGYGGGGGGGAAGGVGGAGQAGGAAGTQGVGSTDSGGGSIYDKLFALLSKLQDQLNQQVDAASQLDPSNQAGLQKAMFQVQQTQNLMQQIVTTATNLLKSQSDTQMSEARNLTG